MFLDDLVELEIPRYRNDHYYYLILLLFMN